MNILWFNLQHNHKHMREFLNFLNDLCKLLPSGLSLKQDFIKTLINKPLRGLNFSYKGNKCYHIIIL